MFSKKHSLIGLLSLACVALAAFASPALAAKTVTSEVCSLQLAQPDLPAITAPQFRVTMELAKYEAAAPEESAPVLAFPLVCPAALQAQLEEATVYAAASYSARRERCARTCAAPRSDVIQGRCAGRGSGGVIS